MVVPEELPAKDDGVGSLPLTVMVKSDGFLSPPPSLTTCVITTNVPSCGLSSEVSFDDSDDDEDIFLLLLSWDSAYEFKSTKVDKDNTVAIIKRIKLKANQGVSFGNNILLLLLDYYPNM